MLAFQGAFAAALLDADPRIPAAISNAASPDAARRFGIYRNNVNASLSAALAARFPVIVRLVGEEFFRAMTLLFVGRHPPRSPLPAAMAADEHYVKEGAAVGGYDVVAYHKVGASTMGSSTFTAAYQGVMWHFASAENRDAFTASPAKYARAYGGWCSAGASKGKKVATKPEFWKIVDGQLYLNSSEVAHTKLFLGDTAGVIRRGEMNWKTIYATEAAKL